MAVRLTKDGTINKTDTPTPDETAQDKAETMAQEMQRRMDEIERMTREAIAGAAEAIKATTPPPASNAQLDGEAAAQRVAIEGEPTTRVRLPLISKNDPVVDVTINGASFAVPRGQTVELPQSVVEVLEHAGLL